RALGSIRWAARYNRNTEVKERACQIRDSIVPDFDMRLTELLLGDHSPLREDDDYDGDVTASFTRRRARLEQMSRSVAKQIVRDHPDPRDGLDVLSSCLDLIHLEERFGRPETFLFGVAGESLGYAIGLCEAILASPDRSLASHFDLLLMPIHRSDPERG